MYEIQMYTTLVLNDKNLCIDLEGDRFPLLELTEQEV